MSLVGKKMSLSSTKQELSPTCILSAKTAMSLYLTLCRELGKENQKFRKILEDCKHRKRKETLYSLVFFPSHENDSKIYKEKDDLGKKNENKVNFYGWIETL